MNRSEWLGKLENYDTSLNTMINAIPNFYLHNDKFIEAKYLKYYQRLNTIIIEINRVKKTPYLKINTIDIENKVEKARELLRIELDKRSIPNEWNSKLPDMDNRF